MTENKEETVEESQDGISLGQVATEHRLVYMTPEGNMTQEEYLVWIGNTLLKIKEALAGN